MPAISTVSKSHHQGITSMYSYPTTNRPNSKTQRQNIAVTCACLSFFSALTLAVMGLQQTLQAENEAPIISVGDINPRIIGGSMLAGSAFFFVIGCCIIRTNRKPENNFIHSHTTPLNQHQHVTITEDPESARKEFVTPKTLTKALTIAAQKQKQEESSTRHSFLGNSNSV